MTTKREQSGERFILHRAAWVVPITLAPIDNGAILATGDSIVAVGRYRDLKSAGTFGAKEVDHGNAALCPSLVNSHTHLELSYLRGKMPFPQSSFAAWLEDLFAQRSRISEVDQAESSLSGVKELLAGGVALYGDVTNGFNLSYVSEKSFPAVRAFLELLGFDRYELKSAVGPDLINVIQGENPKFCLAAHACYSTSAEVIRLAKAWSRKRKRPFAIHLAEHPEEIQFLQDGNGYCRGLLEFLGKWVADWAPPKMTPVEYLDFLGVLDEDTLLVHAVHMKDTDWDIVAGRNCHVCFCPRSNRNLNVGRPAIAKCLQLGIAACLGTDSLASNTDLNLFAEAHHILQNYPEVAPKSLLFMMTMAGARALKRDQSYGSFESGKRSTFLSVSLPSSLSPRQLNEQIIYQGYKGEWNWINRPQLD